MEVSTDAASGQTLVWFPADSGMDCAYGELLCTWLRRQPGVRLAAHTSPDDMLCLKLRLDDPAGASTLVRAAFRARAAEFRSIIDNSC